MTDSAVKPVKELGKPFKKGYDPRRWLQGRPKKPASQKTAEELVQHVIWEILSEEILNPATGEKVDRLRAMLRSMTTNKNMQDKILDRVLGKVAQPVELGEGGDGLQIKIIKASDDKDTDSG